MTKRSGARASHEETQADLFGGAPPPAPKKTRTTAKTARAVSPASRTTPKAQSPDSLLNVRQAAARLGLSKSTLDKMRGAGKGPRYIKSTDRAVRYDPADLDAWISARRSCGTTSD